MAVKLPVSDLLDDCRADDIALESTDTELAERVKTRVLGELARREEKKPAHLHRTARLALLIAAVLLLFGGIAYASGAFRMKLEPLPADTSESHLLHLEDEEGNELVYRMGDRFLDGMIIRFSGDTAPREVEVRPRWLPEEPTLWLPYEGDDDPNVPRPVWDWDDPAWCRYLIDDRERETDWYPAEGVFDTGIPCLITVEYTLPGQVLVLMGTCDILGQETWDGGVEVTKIACAKDIYEASGTEHERHLVSYENYVLLYSRDAGWMVCIGGSSDMETLTHVARELEIRETGAELTPRPGYPDRWVNPINIARG